MNGKHTSEHSGVVAVHHLSHQRRSCAGKHLFTLCFHYVRVLMFVYHVKYNTKTQQTSSCGVSQWKQASNENVYGVGLSGIFSLICCVCCLCVNVWKNQKTQRFVWLLCLVFATKKTITNKNKANKHRPWDQETQAQGHCRSPFLLCLADESDSTPSHFAPFSIGFIVLWLVVPVSQKQSVQHARMQQTW